MTSEQRVSMMLNSALGRAGMPQPKEEHAMKLSYFLEVVETATAKVERRTGPYPARMAERLENAYRINLNHDKYHVRVVENEGTEQ